MQTIPYRGANHLDEFEEMMEKIKPYVPKGVEVPVEKDRWLTEREILEKFRHLSLGDKL